MFPLYKYDTMHYIVFVSRNGFFSLRNSYRAAGFVDSGFNSFLLTQSKLPLFIYGDVMKKLCECGCGSEVKTGKRFVQGHGCRGIRRIFTDEHKKNLSKAHKGRKRSKIPDEVRKKISITAKKNYLEGKNIPPSAKGRKPWNYGKKATEEHKKNMSKGLKGIKHSISYEGREKLRQCGRELSKRNIGKPSKLKGRKSSVLY